MLSREISSKKKNTPCIMCPWHGLPSLGLQSVYGCHLEPVAAAPLWRSRGWWDLTCFCACVLSLPSTARRFCLTLLELGYSEEPTFTEVAVSTLVVPYGSWVWVSLHIWNLFKKKNRDGLFFPRWRRARRNGTGGEELSAVWLTLHRFPAEAWIFCVRWCKSPECGIHLKFST